MNPMHRWVRHVAVAAAALSMSAPAPSWASQLPGGERQEHAHDAATLPGSPGDGMMNGMMSGMMKGHEDAMARGAAMDDRIKALVADMQMFTGEFKVAAMAALLTAIVQRQSVMRDEMSLMHGEMMHRMMERREPAVSPEEEPGTMCSPSP